MEHLDPNADFHSFFAGVQPVAKGGEPECVFGTTWKLRCGHIVDVGSGRDLGSCPACGAMLIRCPYCLRKKAGG